MARKAGKTTRASGVSKPARAASRKKKTNGKAQARAPAKARVRGAPRRGASPGIEASLDKVLARLMRAVSASRCTVRLDDEAREWSVAIPCGEARKAGAASLKLDGSINQRAAATAIWLEKHRRNLIQPDVTRAVDPAPPPALIKVYGVKAQMLSPIFREDGWLQGWISVHYLDGPHAVDPADIVALDRANAEVRKIAGIK